MSESIKLKKVLWRDGDVISEKHFYALEDWTEQLVGLVNQQRATFGMIRSTWHQPEYNKLSNVTFKQIEGSHYRVDIMQMHAINAFGRFLKIDALRSMDFHFRPVQRSADGNYLLYLLPVSSAQNGTYPDDVEIVTDTSLYDTPYELSASNDQNAGVAICRFRVEENQIVPDPTYIPFGIFIDSTSASSEMHDRILEKFRQWTGLLDRYIVSLKPIPEMMLVWHATAQLLRTSQFAEPTLAKKTASTFDYFTSLQQFFNAVRTEVRILSLGWQQEGLRKRADELATLLEQPLVTPVGQQFELASAFALAEKMIDTSVKFLSYMPAGPITEKALGLRQVDFQKEAAGNKIIIHLEEETAFTKGKTRLNIQLRDFSRADPLGGNTRVGLGSVIFAQLLDLKGHLKKVPGEAFSYIIDCPPEVITRDKATQLTLYLPPPLGEGVTDMKNHIIIVAKD